MKKAVDASDLVTRRNARTIFAGKVLQQQAFLNRETTHLNDPQLGRFDFQKVITTTVGAVDTTPEELALLLSGGAPPPPPPPALVVTVNIPSQSLTLNEVVVSYQPVLASGGVTPYTFSVSPALPTGLSLDSATGNVTGTPTVLQGVTGYTYTVTDSVGQSGFQDVFLQIADPPLVLTLNTSAVTFIVGVNPGTITPASASGGTTPYTFAISPSLPAGLSFNTTNCTITGTPTISSAAANYVITVTDNFSRSDSETLSIDVLPANYVTPPGNGCLNFAGSTASYIDITPNGTNFDIGAEDFTIEWFQWLSSDKPAASRAFSIGSYANTTTKLAISYEGLVYIWTATRVPNGIGSTATVLKTNGWQHIALVGTGGNVIKMYVNGGLKGTVNASYAYTQDSNELTIGGEPNHLDTGAPFKGYINNFRWVKGTALYTSNFTPPTNNLTAVTGTKLLLNTAVGAYTTDSSGLSPPNTIDAQNTIGTTPLPSNP